MVGNDGHRWLSDITPRGALLVAVLASVTIGATFMVRKVNAEDRTQARRAQTEAVSTSIQRRVDAYIEVLHGVRGLHASTDGLDHRKFAEYVTTLEPEARFPGAQVIGTALHIHRDELAALDARLARDVIDPNGDYPQFVIHPVTDRDELLPISYVHPVEGNEAAYGLDFFSEENRRTAAERSRDTGQPAATAPVTLVQETATQRAFLVMLAFYDDPSVSAGSVSDRRAGFAGSVYAAFRMGDLVEGVVDVEPDDTIEVYDIGPSDEPVDLARIETASSMYATHDELRAPSADVDADELTTVDVAGRRWAIHVSRADTGSKLTALFPWVVLIGGFALMALVAIVLVATARAQRANRTKSEFLSRMSHELRTPLNAVIGFAQVLAMSDLDDEEAESAAQIETAGKHLLALINEVLDISRIETGHLSLSVEPVDLDEVLDEVARLLEPIASQHGIALHFCDEPTNAVIEADRQRLKQVLINLGSNAVKYNRPEGSVSVCVRRDENRMQIRVTDTGRGLTAAQRHRLFAPFDRLGAEVTGIEGAGLGLMLTKMLTEAMGGTIGVESTEGVGSTFWIEFDAATATDVGGDDAEPGPSTADDPAEVAGRVLYIEDNPANASLMRAIFRRRPNVSLDIASTGADGVALAAEREMDLVLLDVNLPNSHGADVLRELRAIDPGRHLPVVMVSADATAASIAELMAAGVDGYLTKPVHVSELLATVDAHLTRHRVPVGLGSSS